MAKKAAVGKARSPARASGRTRAKLQVVQNDPPQAKANILTRAGDHVLGGVRNSYRPDPVPAGAGRIHRAFHVGADVLERRVFQVPVNELVVRPAGLAMKGAGHAVTVASSLSQRLHAKNANSPLRFPLSSGRGPAAQSTWIAGGMMMAPGIMTAGLSRALAAQEAGASNVGQIGAGVMGVARAATVPAAVGLGLHAIGRFAGLSTKALLGKYLLGGSIAYNAGSGAVQALKEGKGATGTAKAAAWGALNTFFPVEAMKEGVAAWRGLANGPQRLDAGDARSFAAANERYHAMRSAAGEADQAKKRRGYVVASGRRGFGNPNNQRSAQASLGHRYEGPGA